MSIPFPATATSPSRRALAPPYYMSSSELVSHHDRDLRTRTLTSLLAALSPVTRSLSSTTADTTETMSSWDDTCPSDNTIIQERPLRASYQRWLKFLNHVAQLLVREHEIVAVIPQRTGTTGPINLLVATDSSDDDSEGATDSSSDDDDSDSVTGYLITRNPRFNSPEPFPGNPSQQLADIHSYQGMLQYFNTYPHVSYRNHVLAIQVLFNAIIDAWRTYTKVLGDRDSGSTATGVQEARATLVLRRNLLKSFVTFYSLKKIHRRFHSAPLAGFNAGMTGMSQVQVEGAFDRASRPGDKPLFTASEMSFFMTLLGEYGANSYPSLSAALSGARAQCTLALYTKETAWDLHQLLLFVLDRAQVTVDTLYIQINSASTLPLNISTSLSNVQYAMSRLHFLVHYCPTISVHMKSIESLLSVTMALKPTNMMSPKAPFPNDLDQDGGATDTIIEISLAHQAKRVGEECLWLAVRYQSALESVTEDDALPTDPVTLTLCDLSDGDASKRELHDWKCVMRSLYPPANPATNDISCDEAIKTLEEWARQGENRVRATHILRKSSHAFGGCWHAEAMLGTLRHLSKLEPRPATLPADLNLIPFKQSFGSIGVSKRCCPVCTKLLSLFAIAPTPGNDGSRPSTILASHQTFYPTALPPHIPKGIADELLVWLERLVQDAVKVLVTKRRLELRRNKEHGEKEGRANSADSKGESPAKKGKRKRAKEPEWNDVVADMWVPK